MEMNSPVGSNALDAQDVVGKPLDRVDGRLKVTGGARYAYEMQQNTLYGFVVEASIGKGTIRSIDTRAAEKAPGVVLILTHHNAPEQGTGNHREAHPVLTGSEVTRYGQPVAFVVAESFEQARAAAYLVDVKYDRSGGKYALRANLDQARVPHPNDAPVADSAVGDFASAIGIRTEESSVIAELKAGSEEAYAWLVGEFHQPVYSLVYRILTDPDSDPVAGAVRPNEAMALTDH